MPKAFDIILSRLLKARIFTFANGNQSELHTPLYAVLVLFTRYLFTPAKNGIITGCNQRNGTVNQRFGVMIKRIFIYIFAISVLKLVSPVSAQPYMPVEEIQVGMVGIGKTVFQGTQIDTFEAEVLGVLRNVFGPKSDMILARLSGGPLAETGVIAGMSGSPVYIDGKLIGAVGYAIGPVFVNEPIAGITPIGEMVALFDRPDTVAYVSERSSNRAALEEIGSIKPVAVPLVLSGFAPQAVAEFQEELVGHGFMPMQGGAAADTTLAEGIFEPGSPLGVQLIRGDMSVTSMGTLTHRIGDRVVGFGHEMLSLGTTEMPMTAGYIHHVLSSQMSSFKLGVATKPMGVIVQDRVPGVAGVIGKQARMMPVRIEIASPKSHKTFEMDVLQSRLLGPVLVNMAVTSSFMSAEKMSGETTVDGAVSIYMKDRAPIQIENTFASLSGAGLAVLGLTQPVAQLMRNVFEPVVIDSIIFKMSLEERTQAARITGVYLSQDHFEPGDTILVDVSVAPLLGATETFSLALKIPYYASNGRAILRVMAEKASRSLDAKRAPGAYQTKRLDDVIRLISSPGRNDVLVVELLSGTQTLTVAGQEMGMLPESVVMALSQIRKSEVVQQVRQSLLGRTKKTTDYVLVGSQTVLLNIGGDGLTFTGKGTAGEQKR
jgi:hypothetical protein